MLLSDAFDSLFDFQRALDSFRASNWLESSPSGGGPYPPLNVFRKGDDFVVVMELPGIKRDQLDISVKGNTIRIAGPKSAEYAKNASVHRRERLAGRFDRAVTVPVEIDADKVNAEYRDGIVALFLPRAERDKPRLIKVA
jgi:HSP20 family protein